MSRGLYAEPVIMFITLIRWFVLASITGIVVGAGTSLFLHGLFYGIGKTDGASLPIHLLLLPIGGLLNGLLLYYGYKKTASPKADSVIASVHERFGKMPFRTAPIKPLAAILTLALGGSAGKEGPCAHIGGTVASFLGRLLHAHPEVQKRLVMCGISAGFASVFGTPLAGTIYGIEVLTIGQLRHDVLFPSFVAGVMSYEVSRFFGISYEYYPFHNQVSFAELLFIKIVLLGIVCGLAAWLFIELYERCKFVFGYVQQRFHIWRPLMPFIGSLVLCMLILFLPTDYLGLSLPLMDTALSGAHIAFFAFFWKLLFVAITLGSGFYGGIVTPQFVIGATVGNAFSGILHINPVLGAAVGMVAVVAACSNTPIAAIVMGFELFGSSIGVYILSGCIAAYVMVGHRSVYPEQLVTFRKSLWVQLEPGIPLNQEDIHMSYGFLRRTRFLFHHKKPKGHPR